MAIEDLEANLGLTFNDRGLLRQALVHRSFLNEHGGSTLDSYERLEFLGDAVLELIVSTELYGVLPHVTEGELTKARSSLVCRAGLANAARRVSLGEHLILGKGEVESGGHDRESFLEEAFEAVVAAIYLDQGYDVARRFVSQTLAPDLVEISQRGRSVDNPKSQLQELIQGRGEATPLYRLISAEGPDHKPVFTVQVLVGEMVLGQGTGNRKSDAERAAAQVALDSLAGAPASASITDPALGFRNILNDGAANGSEPYHHKSKLHRNEHSCSHSSSETGKETRKRRTRESRGAGNAGSEESSMFSGPLTWMKRLGTNLKKS